MNSYKFTTQINNTNELFNGKNAIKIFLAKAEIKNQLIEVDKLLLNAESFSSFDILGFTEKELGHSILERMKNIAQVRDHNDELGINIPIHVFGSLDPITTPLYFLAGADIFDGLSWLRYTYHDYFSGYTYSIGSVKWGIENTQQAIWDVSVRDNYGYIKEMELTLREVHRTKAYEPLESTTSNSEFFEQSYYQFEQELRGDN